jgi:hypothetical protein
MNRIDKIARMITEDPDLFDILAELGEEELAISAQHLLSNGYHVDYEGNLVYLIVWQNNMAARVYIEKVGKASIWVDGPKSGVHLFMANPKFFDQLLEAVNRAIGEYTGLTNPYI